MDETRASEMRRVLPVQRCLQKLSALLFAGIEVLQRIRQSCIVTHRHSARFHFLDGFWILACAGTRADLFSTARVALLHLLESTPYTVEAFESVLAILVRNTVLVGLRILHRKLRLVALDAAIVGATDVLVAHSLRTGLGHLRAVAWPLAKLLVAVVIVLYCEETSMCIVFEAVAGHILDSRQCLGGFIQRR